MLVSMLRVFNSRMGQTALQEVQAPVIEISGEAAAGMPAAGAMALVPHGPMATAEYVKAGSQWAPAFVEDGIATVYVTGILAKGLSGMEKMCTGGVGPEDVARSLKAVAARADVRAIIMCINSPGGYIAGIPELGNLVASIQRSGKKIYAFNDGMICSAAYWMAAACTRILSPPLADVGSIGVYCVALDWSKFYEEAGVEVHVVKDGKFKGQGIEGTPITDEFLAQLKEDVQEIGTAFRSHVTAFRRVKREDMEGQSFSGQKASSRGLIDAFAADLEEVRRKIDAN